MRVLVSLLLAVAAAAEQGMVLVPAGEFTMGRAKLTPDDKTSMRPHVLLDDRPDHQVRLDPYWIDKTEATHQQYGEFLKATGRRPPYHWPDARMPGELASVAVYNVDWDDAAAYCAWAGKRLPTEAEWERAARGGKEGLDYPWGEAKPNAKLALFNLQSGPGPVGQFPATGFGLHDLAGGVSEWCSDWFERDYYKNSPAANPQGPPTGRYKVIRGGAWSDSPARISVFFRNWVRPNQRTPNLGCRCVKSAR